MRIAVISLYLPTGLRGGVPQQVHLISNELVRRGHHVTVFSLFPRSEDARYAVCQVQLPTWASRLLEIRKGAGIHLFPWYLRRADFSCFDLVHAHGDSHFIKTTCPVVRTFHSSGLDEALSNRSLLNFLGMMTIYPLEMLSGVRARARTFVGSALRTYYPFEDVTLVPNAVDLDRFSAGAQRSAEPSILFVAGTRRRRKRGDLLVRQFQEHVLEQIPTAELWMVCKERLEGRGIHFLGPVTDEDLIRLYRTAWVFCLPSAHENFGIPYVEALACGTPVVATPNAGASEILQNGRYGVIVPPAKLGRALVDLLKDEAQRSRLAKVGLAHAHQFSLTTVVDMYEALYAKILQAEGSEGSTAGSVSYA